jgi:hypothetical protein
VKFFPTGDSEPHVRDNTGAGVLEYRDRIRNNPSLRMRPPRASRRKSENAAILPHAGGHYCP